MKHRTLPFSLIPLVFITLLTILLGAFDSYTPNSHGIIRATVTTTSSTSTVVVPVPIPGFPFTSILLGMLLGIVVLTAIRKKRSNQNN